MKTGLAQLEPGTFLYLEFQFQYKQAP
jgi:hypothetical protein